MPPRLLWFSIFFLTQLPTAAWAAGEGLDLTTPVPGIPSPDIAGIRPMGMGNSGLALADGPEGFVLNPAGLSRFKGSFVEGGFYFHPSADQRVINISVADAKTNPIIAGGMAYSYYVSPRIDDGKYQTVEGHIIRLATSFRYKKTLFAGVVVKYLQLNRPFFQPLSAAQVDVGITWQIIPLLSVSVVGYNLVYNDSGETPISLGFGLAFGYNFPLRITADWVMDFQSHHKLMQLADPDKADDLPLQIGHELRVGIEYLIAKIVSIRAGYHFDHTRNSGHHLGLGVGVKYKQFGGEIAFRQQLAGDRQSENRTLAFSARIYF